MKLYLYGEEKELLASFVPAIDQIEEAHYFSKIEPLPTNLHEKDLAIVDLNNIQHMPSEVYSKLSKHFSTIWAYYSQADCPVQLRLLKMGFNRVFSYEDNVAESIKIVAQNT